jgi:uncharacterized protein (TIGR02466 family)
MDRLALFSTPVFVYDVPQSEALNRELAERLQAEADSTPGLVRSNRGGWHSPPDLAQRPEQCYRALIRMIVDHVGFTMDSLAATTQPSASHQWRFAPHAWAMVMRDGDYTILHDHITAHWAISYYVDEGNSNSEIHPESGVLAFVDPRRHLRPIPGFDDFNMTTFTVRPKAGRLVVFPGWLQHYVHPYRGTRPRIAIASNVTVGLSEPGNV